MTTHATSYRRNPDWRQLGKCFNHPHPDLWFPEQGQTGREAKAICATCHVRQRCLDWALAKPEPFGIWGGTSEPERRLLRGNKPRVHKTQAPIPITFLPAAPLREALQSLVSTDYESRNALSRAVGHRTGMSPGALSSFLSKTEQKRVSVGWATRVATATSLDLAAIYPERSQTAA